MAKATEPKDKLLIELVQAKTPYDVMVVYYRDREGFKNFVRQQRMLGKTDIPDIVFESMDKYWEYDGYVRFIIIDGGEIREDNAFETDGVTVKKGFRRLYWK